MLKDTLEVEKKEEKESEIQIAKERRKIESRLGKTKSLTDKDRRDIVEWFYLIGLCELNNIAFKTGRITEYQYYRLQIEDEKNGWLRAITRGEGDII